ncbi:hypothetical protein DFS33DRAFT_1273644 [Desarmillaria ectypa]|nr:hypothetical protein DFS33DRAFT_1273644 [Desarmillaria ectypa]
MTWLRVGVETRTYMSSDDIEYFAINASALKDDKDKSAILPDTAGIRTPKMKSMASSINIDPEGICSGSSTQKPDKLDLLDVRYRIQFIEYTLGTTQREHGDFSMNRHLLFAGKTACFSKDLESTSSSNYKIEAYSQNPFIRFKREKTKVIIAMIVLNTIMWSVSTTHVMITIVKIHWVYLRGAEHGDVITIENNRSPGLYSLLTLECVNVHQTLTTFFIGDGIVLWRAWILCNRSKQILWMSSILGIAAFGEVTIIMVLMLSINVWATSLITYCICSTPFRTHYRLIRSLTGSFFASQFCKQHSILSLIIESGIFYCCTWAIYPTLIIALICLRLTLEIVMQSSRQMSRSQQSITGPESSNHPIFTLAPWLKVETETMTSSSCGGIGPIRINSPQKEDNTRSSLLGHPIIWYDAPLTRFPHLCGLAHFSLSYMRELRYFSRYQVINKAVTSGYSEQPPLQIPKRLHEVKGTYSGFH